MKNLIYKRDIVTYDDGDVQKAYSVVDKDNNESLGFLKNDDMFGWIFFESIDHDWFGGHETLREAKEWLESINNEEQIIIKLLKQ